MLSVFILSHAMYSCKTLFCFQTVKCETSAPDMTGMLGAGVLDVITVKVMTERAD